MIKRFQAEDESPPPIGLHTLMGPKCQTMVKNSVKNYEGFVVLAQGVFEPTKLR